LPLIAWIDKSETQSSEKVIGHFVVLISCTPENVIYLDGTSGEKNNLSATTFLKQWNGMVLIEQKQSTLFFDYFGIFCFLFGLLCIILVKIFDKKKIITALICLAIFGGSSGQAFAVEESIGIWRKQENESINALYLLLRCHDLPCNYHSIENEFKQLSTKTNLHQLQKQAEKHGLSMSVFHSRSPDILNTIPIPFLIHMENGENENEANWNGNYLLVIGRGNKSYMIVECGTVQISDIPEEMLRRYWSGYGLAYLPKQKNNFVVSVICSSLIGLGIFLVYLGIVSKKIRRTEKNRVTICVIFICLLSLPCIADDTYKTPDAIYSVENVKNELLKSANKIDSLHVTYRSEYYTNPNAPKGTYLYRRIFTKKPYFLNHTNSHPCDAFTWDKDPLLQQAFIQKNIGYNIFPFNNTYFVLKLSSDDGLPGTLPEEFFFNATGIWIMNQRKAPRWGDIPVALCDVANDSRYDLVRPQQEKIDGHWCHVLCYPNHDSLWIDMERGAVILARETFHPETGTLMQRYELSNHREAASDIWIPQKLRNIQYDFASQTEEGRKRKVIDGFFDVDKIEVNTLTESDFDFTPPRGALLVYDAREPDKQYPYQSVADGQNILDDLAIWIRSNTMLKTKAATKSSFGWYICFLVFPLIIFLEIKKRLKSK
jgi:hypothetical protein